MTLQFLIGAILGSGLFIFAGRAPARRAVAYIRERIERRPR